MSDQPLFSTYEYDLCPPPEFPDFKKAVAGLLSEWGGHLYMDQAYRVERIHKTTQQAQTRDRAEREVPLLLYNGRGRVFSQTPAATRSSQGWLIPALPRVARP